MFKLSITNYRHVTHVVRKLATALVPRKRLTKSQMQIFGKPKFRCNIDIAVIILDLCT